MFLNRYTEAERGTRPFTGANKRAAARYEPRPPLIDDNELIEELTITAISFDSRLGRRVRYAE